MKTGKNSIMSNNGWSIHVFFHEQHTSSPSEINPLYRRSMLFTRDGKASGREGKMEQERNVHVLTAPIYNIITDMLCAATMSVCVCVCWWRWWCLYFVSHLCQLLFIFRHIFTLHTFLRQFFLDFFPPNLGLGARNGCRWSWKTDKIY